MIRAHKKVAGTRWQQRLRRDGAATRTSWAMHRLRIDRSQRTPSDTNQVLAQTNPAQWLLTLMSKCGLSTRLSSSASVVPTGLRVHHAQNLLQGSASGQRSSTSQGAQKGRILPKPRIAKIGTQWMTKSGIDIKRDARSDGKESRVVSLRTSKLYI